MTFIAEALRQNPKAAEELEMVKEVLTTLRQLRETGLVGKNDFRPVGRSTLADLKPRGVVRAGIRMTVRM